MEELAAVPCTVDVLASLPVFLLPVAGRESSLQSTARWRVRPASRRRAQMIGCQRGGNRATTPRCVQQTPGRHGMLIMAGRVSRGEAVAAV